MITGYCQRSKKAVVKGLGAQKTKVLIDKAIIKNCKRRNVGLSMGWIDFKKAFYMIPHSWILRCLEIFGIAENIKSLRGNSMKNWETELTSSNQSLGRVKIKREIFQGNSLPLLLFVICLIPLSFILRKVNAGYQFRKGGPTVNHLLYMDDLKLFAKLKNNLMFLLTL